MRLDSLRLLCAAEIPRDLENINALLAAIAERRHELEEGSDPYAFVGRRIDDLLEARNLLVAEAARAED